MSSTCRWCGGADVDPSSEEEACSSCSTPIPDDVTPPMTIQMRVFRAIKRNPGIGIAELVTVTETAEENKNALSAEVYRLVRDGAVRREGSWMRRRFFALDESKVKRQSSRWTRRWEAA